MEEIKRYEYEGNMITFLTGENIVINATEMAKKFNAKPESWLRTDQAQRMIDAIAVAHNCDTTDLVIVKQGGNPNEQGTWMHEDIAIIFSQWLSPEFYIWCNDRIKELFKYGVTMANEAEREVIFSLWDATGKLKNNSSCKIGRHGIYKLLRLKGILNEHNKPLSEYVDKGYFEMKPYEFNHYVKHPVVTEEGLKWLNQTLYPEQLDVENERLEKIESDIRLLLNGVEAIGNTILVGKSGNHNEEQNRNATTSLRIAMEKIKNVSENIALIKK